MAEVSLPRKLDRDFWSFQTLPSGASGEQTVKMFDGSESGYSGNIPSAGQFSTTQKFTLYRVSSVLTLASGAALTDTNKTILSNLINRGYVELKQNGVVLMKIPLLKMHRLPVAVLTSGGDNMEGVMKGVRDINIPIEFAPGAIFEYEFKYTAIAASNAFDYVAIMSGILEQVDTN